MRPSFQWDLGRRKLPLGERTLIMGVLNVTPDSFSDGGLYLDPQAAILRGLALLDEGADILDIGGESTRPGTPTASDQAPVLAGAVSAQQELDRVLPIIQSIKQQRPDSILSIDTYKSMVARYAVDAGAEIVNDVSGFTWDSAMASTVAERPCGAILMHVRGLPHQWRTQPPDPDIVSLVREQLRDRVSEALDHGISRASIVLDPGFGFGKNFDENYPLLARLAELHLLGFPLLVGTSRKSFLGHTISARLHEISRQTSKLSAVELAAPEPLDAPHLVNSADAALPNLKPIPLPPVARDTATLAATVAAALAGAHIVRVHAVRPAVEALAIADAILRAESLP
jgi:dihydropteroate synthase